MRRQILFVLPFALGLAACSRCGKGPGAGASAELTRALPRQAEAVLVVPDLGALGEKVAVLQRLKLASFLAQLLGFGTAEDFVNTLVAQAGTDFRSREALRAAGLEPDRGLGVALLAGDRAYTVVAVHDGKKLEETLARLARDRLGAGVATTVSSEGQRQISFAKATGLPPELSLVLKDGLAFIAAGASARELPTFAALSSSASLAEDSDFASSLGRLPKERDLWIHVPSAASQLSPVLLRGATFTARLSAEAILLRADLPWPADKRALEVLAKKDGPDLFPLLPHDAFLVARFSGEPALLAPFLPYLEGERVAKAIEDSGLDVKGEVLENLQPGMVLSLSVSPSAKLGAMPSLDVRRTNPFRFVQLVAAAAVRDPAKAARTLEQSPKLAALLGARVEPAEREGHKVFLTSYAQGEGAHLAQAGSDVVMAAPEARLLETLGRAGKPLEGPPLSDAALMKGFDERAVALVVDLRRLSDSVKALPSDAWGVGGFAMKATTVRWLEATDDLRAITVSLAAKERAVEAELALRLAPP